MNRGVALLLAIVGGAIAAYTTILLVAGGLLGVGWLWVFGDDPWPGWAMTGLNVLIPVGGLTLWAIFSWLIWSRLRGARRARVLMATAASLFAFSSLWREKPMTSVPETAPQDSVLRYSNTAVTFHWITVVLVVAQAIVGFGFHRFSEGALRDELFTWHKTIGPLILLITLARLWYRLRNPPPPFPPELPQWERTAAVWNHRLFYTLLIAMPLVGLAAISGGAEAPTTKLAGGIPFPLIPGISKQTGDLLGEVHMFAAWLLVALILIHIAAALKHQFVDHWRGSARMPPFSSNGEPVRIGQGRGEALQEG